VDVGGVRSEPEPFVPSAAIVDAVIVPLAVAAHTIALALRSPGRRALPGLTTVQVVWSFRFRVIAVVPTENGETPAWDDAQQRRVPGVSAPAPA
jgi:hypothetical protein